MALEMCGQYLPKSVSSIGTKRRIGIEHYVPQQKPGCVPFMVFMEIFVHAIYQALHQLGSLISNQPVTALWCPWGTGICATIWTRRHLNNRTNYMRVLRWVIVTYHTTGADPWVVCSRHGHTVLRRISMSSTWHGSYHKIDRIGVKWRRWLRCSMGSASDDDDDGDTELELA